MDKTALEEVANERTHQDEKWGGPNHDDYHSAADWITFLSVYLGKAAWGATWDVTFKMDLSKFKANMRKIAALGVAAMEWCDRQEASKDGDKEQN